MNYEKYRNRITLVLFFFFLQGLKGYPQTKKQCDSLIETGIDMMYAQKYIESIQLLKGTYETARRNNWYREYFLSANNIGLNYFKISDYPSAIRYYLQAYAASTKRKESSDEMTVLNNIAVLYVSEGNLQKAETYFLKALQIAREVKTDIKTGYYLTNLGLLAIEENQITKAKEYLSEAKPYLANEKRVLFSNEIGFLEIYLLEKKYRSLAKKANELLQLSRKQRLPDLVPAIELVLAKAYLQQSKLDLALKNLRSGLKKVPNSTLDKRIAFYSVIADVYAMKHDYRKASQYKDSIYLTSERLHQESTSQLYTNNQLRFDLLTLERDLAKEKLSNDAKRKNLVWIIVCLFLSLTLIVVLASKKIKDYKNAQKIKESQLKKSENEILKHRSNKIVLEEKLVLSEKNAVLEQEKLQHEIEQRNLKITERMLIQTSKNELIQNILETIDIDVQKSSNPSLVTLVERLKKVVVEDAKWDDYVSLFEEVNPKFIKALKCRHPLLTADDIRFLSYLFLNFETKQISSLLHITPEGVRKRKERILRKMDLTPETNLFTYLISMA